jgi:hypothetical protein
MTRCSGAPRAEQRRTCRQVGRRQRLAHLGVLLAVAGSAACTSASHPTAAAEASTPPSCRQLVATARITSEGPDKRLDGSLDAYIATGKGWTGGDSGYAYQVNGLGTVWTFADSLVGGVLGRHRRGGVFLHNLIVVSDAGHWRVVTGGTPQHRLPLIGPVHASDFFLSLGGTVDSAGLQVFFSLRQWAGAGILDNIGLQTLIATFSLPGLVLRGLKPVTYGPRAIQWGAFVSRFGGWNYIYGASTNGYRKDAYVARVAAGDLNGRWSFWDGSGWSASPRRAAPVRGVETEYSEYSVTRDLGMFVLVGSDSRQAFSPYTDVYLGCSPVGPFYERARFAFTPLVGAAGASYWGDSTVYVHDARVQPAFSSGARLVVSYERNSLIFASVYRDPTLYRTRFVDLSITIPAR